MRPGEPPTLGHGRGAVQRPVLRLRALRPLGGRPREDELAPRTSTADDTMRVLRKRGHPRDPQGAGRPEGRPRRDRRHRPSRQPPGALGRRADGEPVPRRPAAHGARDPRAHELGRDRHRDAARPDQRQAGGGGGARVLRLLAALAVHGPDQPAVGDHPQAAPLGAWAGRPDARARRLRGARRASDALRPDLPDRDAGRPEHRPDQLASPPMRAVNQYGFIESPYRKVDDGTRDRRGRSISRRWRRAATRSPRPTPSSMPKGKLRRRPDLAAARPATSSWPAARTSTASTCRRSSWSRSPRRSIPFLENDDANRALMGSNMQRQAVPLIQRRGAARRHRHGGDGRARFRRRPSARALGRRRPGRRDPHRHPRDRGDRDPTRSGVDIYNLLKFQRSNQNTCINQRPLVKVGDAGDEAATSSPTARRPSWASWRSAATCSVAFMPWNGYNFEDSILISERIVRDDVFTSIHIEEFEVMARDTKLGPGGDHPRHPECRRGSARRTSTRPASSISAPR